MMDESWLVCGTRGKGSLDLVRQKLDVLMWNNRALYKDWSPKCIIEGCCPDSADVWAEEWAKQHNIEVLHHPSTTGNYIRRNIEMVKKATLVIAFWDGFSYGTAHTIAQATMRHIPVIVYVVR